MSIQIEHGIIQSMCVNGHTYRFRTDPEHSGPAFHVTYGGLDGIGTDMQDCGDGWYACYFWGVHLAQRVTETENGVRIEIKLENRSSQSFRPDRVSLELGIDTYMDHYPEWNEKVFPTFLRCEQTHMWGYFRSPAGCILGIASPDPISSWSLDYNSFFGGGGHRIYTTRIDLMSIDRQPDRHPVLESLMPYETRSFTIELFDSDSLENVLKTASAICRAPMFFADRLILDENESSCVTVFSRQKPVLSAGDVTEAGTGVWKVKLPSKDCGLQTLTASSEDHISTLSWYIRKPWSFYLDAARTASLEMPQKTGSHCESWYGLFSGFQAARKLPRPELDFRTLASFEELLPLAFDTSKGIPTLIAGRIQNTAIAVSLCEDAWRMTKDPKWLDIGDRLADYLIDRCQNEEGVFTNNGAHYTCVIYIAKSILELWLAEKDCPGRKSEADKHFRAARKAIDELVRNRDNIGTEGEHTFEDGMISCSFSQISMMALLLPESERAPYIEAAEALLEKHRCLERLASTDARSRNTTLRFWEAQYDVLIPANMINSPHGWSAWKVYGVWYLYLLTGRTEYLIDTMETLGSCAQLIDTDGHLRWAFVPDPCIRAGFWKPSDAGKGYLDRCTFGETYVEMISGWYRAPEKTPVFGYIGDYPEFDNDQGGCCDNDVHECFKALAETAVSYGYIYEDSDGIHTLNGSMENGVFIPAEKLVNAVHVNFKKAGPVTVRFSSGIARAIMKFGWIYADNHISTGLPEET